MVHDTPAERGYDTVEVWQEGYVGRITLSRPDAMNSFSTSLALDLDEALHDLEKDETVRAVVVDGAGPAFSVGIDISEHAGYEGAAEYERWVARMEEPFLTLAEMGTPVIAAAHGYAAANGLGLVAACDLAVVAEGTKLGATAPKVGLFCMGPAVPLMKTLPRKRCLEMILTGELIDAETAADWGLVNRVVRSGEHVEAAVDLAESLVSKSPIAIQLGKQAFYEMADLDYADALEFSNERFADLCATEAAQQGVEAFLSGQALSAEEWPGA
jgi:enoyl-CoA hydratase/carnithine racemase